MICAGLAWVASGGLAASDEVPRFGPIETRAGVAVVVEDEELLAQQLRVGDAVLFADGPERYVWIEAQRGDLLLIGVSNGGTGCPALFTWVHTEPGAVRAVEPYFGSCYDRVEVGHDALAVWVTMPSEAPSEGWVRFVYDGADVTRQVVGQRPSGAAPEAGAEAWVDRYVYEMTRASDWRGPLVALMGEATYQALGRVTTQAVPFEIEGDWVVGWGCNDRFCGGEEAVIALHRETGDIVVAIKEQDAPLVVFGDSQDYPPTVAEFLNRWSD